MLLLVIIATMQPAFIPSISSSFDTVRAHTLPSCASNVETHSFDLRFQILRLPSEALVMNCIPLSMKKSLRTDDKWP